MKMKKMFPSAEERQAEERLRAFETIETPPLDIASVPETPSGIAKLSAHVKARSKDLDDVFDAFVAESKRIGLTVRGELILDREEDQERALTYFTCLIFGKNDGKWNLWIERQVHVDGDEDCSTTNVTPIHKASRQLRIAAAKELPALHKALNARFKSNAKELEDAYNVARSAVEDMKGVSDAAITPADVGVEEESDEEGWAP